MNPINVFINWIYSCIPTIGVDNGQMTNCKCRQINPNHNHETLIDIEAPRFLLTPDMLERGIAYHHPMN